MTLELQYLQVNYFMFGMDLSGELSELKLIVSET